MGGRGQTISYPSVPGEDRLLTLFDDTIDDDPLPTYRCTEIVDSDKEHWIENDDDLDEYLCVNDTIIPPQEVGDLIVDDPQINRLVSWIVVLVAVFQTKFRVTDRAIDWLLRFISAIFKAMAFLSPRVGALSEAVPRSFYRFKRHMVTFIPDFESFDKNVACRQCFSLYTCGECLDRQSVKKCSFKPFPMPEKCDTPLLKTIVSSSGKCRHYPYLFFCSKSIISSLQTLILNSNFMQECESTRNQRQSEVRTYRDVYDGKLWKEFTNYKGKPFLSEPNCYGLLLNVDWFQPFEHVTYSVGVLYISVLNLPRQNRFKIKNTILVPGPKEPSLTINTLLAPLVSDLLDLWKGVSLKVSNGGFATFRCALLGVSCDIPAGRKVCGFLGHSANLGCTRCLQNFSSTTSHRNYSNFDRASWPKRTNQKHRDDVQKVMNCNTRTRRSEMELKLSCRFTVLLDLPYFDPVRMLLIDPMHNLFMGTAKHVARDIWIGRNIIDRKNIQTIQQRLEKFTIPSDFGRLPVTIAPGTFLTAEQWKTWTLYVSIYCLHDILPNEQLECWRHFVLSCRKLCLFEISQNDVTISDALLRFCQRFFSLYGTDSLTPNIHLHCHLTSCVEDFGPLHSFWLFPFERYNGVLGKQPTNNRSVEVQLMRQFLRDKDHLQLLTQCRDWPDAHLFKDLLQRDDEEKVGNLIASVKYSRCCLPQEEVDCLIQLYEKMYPELSQRLKDGIIYVPSIIKKFSSLERNGKRIDSDHNHNAKNSFVIAEPPFNFTTSDPAESVRPRPARIKFFVEHSIEVQNESKPHLFAYVHWPMVHPERFGVGKPVEVWCNDLYEPTSHNLLLPVQSIRNRAIFSVDSFKEEQVLIVIPVLE